MTEEEMVNKTHIMKIIYEQSPCRPAREWLESNGDKSPKWLFKNCQEGAWLLWLVCTDRGLALHKDYKGYFQAIRIFNSNEKYSLFNPMDSRTNRSLLNKIHSTF